MELRYLVVADAAIRREDGKMDILGAGVERIFTVSVPAIHPALTAAIWVILSREEARESHRFELGLTSPRGERVAGGHGDIEPVPAEQLEAIGENEHVSVPLPLPLSNIVLPDFGVYELTFLWDGEPVGNPVPIEVTEASPEE